MLSWVCPISSCAMAATLKEEKLLNLFDNKWFIQNIICPRTPDQQTPEKSQQTPPILFLDSPYFLVRSFSDQCLISTSDILSSKGNVSPDSVLPKTSKKLQTIVSGKEVEELEEKIRMKKQGRKNRREKVNRRSRRERRERSGSGSLSELESEELKGFTDLGFVFSEEDKDSGLASIIPGLQRLGKKQGNNDGGNNHNDDDDDDDDDDRKRRVSRPYLSEAWELLEERKAKMNPLTNWVISSDLVSDEIEMKNLLRFWAHTVASYVR